MKKKIIEHASIFLSYPMTLTELSKRTAVKEEELLREFKYELSFVDNHLSSSVQKVLEYLEKNNMIGCKI